MLAADEVRWAREGLTGLGQGWAIGTRGWMRGVGQGSREVGPDRGIGEGRARRVAGGTLAGCVGRRPPPTLKNGEALDLTPDEAELEIGLGRKSKGRHRGIDQLAGRESPPRRCRDTARLPASEEAPQELTKNGQTAFPDLPVRVPHGGT